MAAMVVWDTRTLEAGACIEIMSIAPLLLSDAQLLPPVRILAGLTIAMVLFLAIIVGVTFGLLTRIRYDVEVYGAAWFPLLGNAANFLVFRTFVLLFFCIK